MSQRLRRRTAFCGLLTLIVGCAPTAEQQAGAFAPAATALESRVRQSRRFDTADQTFMLQAAVGTLQDIGFTIEETQPSHGVIVASKFVNARIRAQVTLRLASGGSGTIVRVTFQRITPRPGAMLAVGETLTDPELYQGFFEKLAQSAFLTAHEI